MSLTVNERMSKHLVSAHITESMDSAYSKMKEARIRHLPILDEHGNLAGILSDRDIQRARVRQPGNPQGDAIFPPHTSVQTYMTELVDTVHADVELRDVIKHMIEAKISSLVVTQHDEVTGIITTEDLLHVLLEVLDKSSKSSLSSRLKGLVYNSPIGTVLELLNQVGI